MKYMITVNHGAVATKETERTFFINADSKQSAYNLSKSKLIDCGIDGYEYVVSIEECGED